MRVDSIVPSTACLPAAFARRIPLDLSQPCWPAPGFVQDHGYAVVMIDGERKYRHRLSYQLHVGPVPRGWEIDHACHSEAIRLGTCADQDDCEHRACWNPAHLEAVSSRENSMRGNHPLFAIARVGVCRRGHDQNDPANVYAYRDGKRRCRRCAIDLQRERRLSSKP